MTEISILSLPMEVIHRIFDFLDFQTILFSIRSVCKRFQDAANQYNRLHVSLEPKQKEIIKSLLSILQPGNVTELSLTKTFPSSLPLQQFTQLSSLNIRKIRDSDLEQIFKNSNTNRLTSLLIESSEEKHANTWKLISKILQRTNLQNLCVPNLYFDIKDVSWPVQYGLQKLVIHNCKFSEYFQILDQLPFLQSLSLDNCSKDKDQTDIKPKTFHTALKSLTINEGSFSSSDFNLLIEPIPELRHLKLVTGVYRKFDSMFDGSYWQEIMQTKLLNLKKLELFIRHREDHRIEPVIATFATPFWLNEKQWIVYCSRALSDSTILYTMPTNVKYKERFQCEMSTIDPTCRFTFTDGVTSTEVEKFRLKISFVSI